MPTNPNAPFGFKYIEKVDGSPPNFGLRQGLIASANTDTIFTGSPLAPVNGSGYLSLAAVVPGGEPLGGVAWSFQWVSKSQNKTVFQNWWPGNGDALGDVIVYYRAERDSLFEVQCLLGPIVQTSVGSNANFSGVSGTTVGAGNQSNAVLDDTTIGVGASLPFKINRLPEQGPLPMGFPMAGYDVTQPYNRVWVTFNNLVG
jgi:hypothetical protein